MVRYTIYILVWYNYTQIYIQLRSNSHVITILASYVTSNLWKYSINAPHEGSFEVSAQISTYFLCARIFVHLMLCSTNAPRFLCLRQCTTNAHASKFLANRKGSKPILSARQTRVILGAFGRWAIIGPLILSHSEAFIFKYWNEGVVLHGVYTSRNWLEGHDSWKILVVLVIKRLNVKQYGKISVKFLPHKTEQNFFLILFLLIFFF